MPNGVTANVQIIHYALFMIMSGVSSTQWYSLRILQDNFIFFHRFHTSNDIPYIYLIWLVNVLISSPTKYTRWTLDNNENIHRFSGDINCSFAKNIHNSHLYENWEIYYTMNNVYGAQTCDTTTPSLTQSHKIYSNYSAEWRWEPYTFQTFRR